MKVSAAIPGGIVAAISSLAYAFAYAALILSGSGLATTDIGYGIEAALIGSAVSAFVVSALSSFPFAIGGMDSNVAAILAFISASIAPQLSAMSLHVAIVNLLYVLLFATMISGAAVFLLGTIRAGRWIRFIPLPVIGGFLAAAGFLIVAGAVRVATGYPLRPQYLSLLFGSGAALHLLATCLFAAIIFVVRPRLKGAIAVPLLLASGIAIVLVALRIEHVSLVQAREAGWLFTAPPPTHLWFPWSAADLGLIKWNVLWSSSGAIGTLALVTTVTILLTSTAIEMESRTEAQLDRELIAQGASCVLCGALGGFAGFISLSRTVMNFHLGVRNRLAGPIVAVIALAFAFGGVGLIGYVPKLVVCGLLLTLGFGLLSDWLWRSYRRLTIAEFGIVWLIFLMIINRGFVPGLAVGVLVGTLIFVFNYSRINVIKEEFTGKDMASNLQRSLRETEILRAHGARTHILFLQGYIFFGMADRLYREVKERIFDKPKEPVRFLILDFTSVQGLDSSAVSSFVKVIRGAESLNARVLLARMSADVKREWLAAAGKDGAAATLFPDVDHALESTEAEVLREWGEQRADGKGLVEWLAAEFHDADLAADLVSRLIPWELHAGDALVRQGEEANSMFFIEQGRIGIYLDFDGRKVRLRSLGARTLLGEMGVYRRTVRSAWAIAEEPSVVHVLTRDRFEHMQREDPKLIAAIGSLIVTMLSERVAYGNALIAALTK